MSKRDERKNSKKKTGLDLNRFRLSRSRDEITIKDTETGKYVMGIQNDGKIRIYGYSNVGNWRTALIINSKLKNKTE